MGETSLTIGGTYFRVTFADRDRSMPGVNPFVFIGEIEESDGGEALAFQDTVSYVRFGPRIGATTGVEEMQVFFVPREDIGKSILTIEQVASEVAAAAQRAVALGHPVLPIIRGGWS